MTEVLKGGVSYYTYVWRTAGNPCDACQAMSGMTFDNYEDIPDLLHPNCQCWIEVIEEDDDKTDDKKEEEKNYDELDLLIGDTLSLRDEILTTIENNNRDYIESTNDNEKKLLASYHRDFYSLLCKLESFYNGLFAGYELENDISYNSFVIKNRAKFSQYEVKYDSIIKYLEIELQRNRKNIERPNPFKDDVEKHKQMLDLIRHAHDKDGDFLRDYEVVRRIHDNRTEMDAVVYKNDKEVVIVYPGSDQLRDFAITDVKLAAKIPNEQYEPAREVYDEVKNDPQYENHKIIVTGYSLGGNTGALVGAQENVDTVVFEPYGTEKETFEQQANRTGEPVDINPEKVVVYKQDGDGYTETGEEGQIGQVYRIPTNEGRGSHDLDDINDLDTRVESTNPNPRNIYIPK